MPTIPFIILRLIQNIQIVFPLDMTLPFLTVELVRYIDTVSCNTIAIQKIPCLRQSNARGSTYFPKCIFGFVQASDFQASGGFG